MRYAIAAIHHASCENTSVQLLSQGPPLNCFIEDLNILSTLGRRCCLELVKLVRIYPTQPLVVIVKLAS